MKTLNLSGISSSQRLAVRKEAFFAALTVGVKEFLQRQDDGKIPMIIHISAHGNNDGIELTSGENVGWNDLKNLLKPINKAMNGNLLVCMSSCRGSSGCRMSMEDDDFPFLVIVGSTEEPTWSETNIGFATFYHQLSRSGNSINDCIKAMNIASGHNKFVRIYSSDARKTFLDTTRIRLEKALDILNQGTPAGQKTSLLKEIGS